MMSFLRLFANPFAGPDGGDGGNGGHVIFEGSRSVRDLSNVKNMLRAERGTAGKSKCCHGGSAEHLIVKAPLGTIFTQTATNRKVYELKEEGELFVAARGGAGGRGNAFYLSNEVRAPIKADAGAPGEDILYDIEMRIVAHAGLIGFPNAGKSTLLRSVSRAAPKVAAYPFTTLNPYIGTITYEDFEQLTIADIPGLVGGAHKNYGMGYSFLRHVQRCLCLFYVLDLSLSDPWQQLDEIHYELEQFEPGLSKRPFAILGNKIDLDISHPNLKILKEKSNLPIFPISAKYRIGIDPLLSYFKKLYDEKKGELP